jgi:sulfate/thiosulfate transport system ATP-binding protein
MVMPLPRATATDSPAKPSGASGLDIRILDVAKAFSGDVAALSGVSLDIAHGELLALLGPSGSGKTTLLRTIAGLEIPDQGQVLLGGIDATHLRPQDRCVGFVFQNYALFKQMSVFDNVAYGLRVRPPRQRLPEAEVRRRVEGLLELVQLEGLQKRYPAQISGGQRQRVALARALAIEPKVLLLDEPFGALDAQVRKELRRWLRDIHQRTGQTTVFVTHDQDEALELADRVAILRRGSIEQVGTPDDIYNQPASAFVASFVGQATVVPVTIANNVAWLAGGALPIAAAGIADGEAQLYLRPTEVQLVDAAAASHVGSIVAVVRTGAGRRVEVRLKGSTSIVEVELAGDLCVAVGDRVGIAVQNGRIFSP